MRARNLSVLLVAVLLSPVLRPAAGEAQVRWPDEGTTVALEVRQPNFDEEEIELSLLSVAYFLSARMPVHERTKLLLEVPFAHAAFTEDNLFGPDGTNSNTLGNIYLGVEHRTAARDFRVQAGVRLPTQEEYGDDDVSTLVGIYASPVERYEAFFEDVTSALVLVSGVQPLSERVGLGLRLGGSYLHYSDDDRDADWFGTYGASVIADIREYRGTLGVDGRMYLSAPEGSELDFGERTIHEAGLSVDRAFGNVRPRLALTLPLDDDLTEVLDLTVSLGIAVTLAP